MEKAIYNGYYKAFRTALYQIDIYHNTSKAQNKRIIMVHNLEFAIAKAYESGEMSWDMARFYRRKIADYTRNCKM